MALNLMKAYRCENHFISSDGGVYNSKTNRWLKPTLKSGGYFHLGLMVNGKQVYRMIHRLIMETYAPIDNMEEMKIDHINGVKTDNRLENLRWCTQAENIKFSTEQGTNCNYNNRKKVICIENGEIYSSGYEAAKVFNTSQGSIYNCCCGRTKSAGGHTFEFAN